jgi:hypothetical protein
MKTKSLVSRANTWSNIRCGLGFNVRAIIHRVFRYRKSPPGIVWQVLALKAIVTGYSGVMFKIRDGKCHVMDHFRLRQALNR